jgi:hypothetical protein
MDMTDSEGGEDGQTKNTYRILENGSLEDLGGVGKRALRWET